MALAYWPNSLDQQKKASFYVFLVCLYNELRLHCITIVQFNSQIISYRFREY